MKVGTYKGIKDSINIKDYTDMVMRVFDNGKVMVSDFRANKREDGRWDVEINLIDASGFAFDEYCSGCDEELIDILKEMDHEYI